MIIKTTLMAPFALCAALFTSACDQKAPQDEAAIMSQHCWASTVFMLKKIAQAKKRESKDWIKGNRRWVLVRYNMIPLEASWANANPTKGEMLCAYKYDPTEDQPPKAAKALEITMNGTKLSRQQIDNLNVMVTLIGQGL